MQVVSVVIELLILSLGYACILCSNHWCERKMSEFNFTLVVALVTVLYAKAVELIIH